MSLAHFKVWISSFKNNKKENYEKICHPHRSRSEYIL